MSEALKPCPFCGGAMKMNHDGGYLSHAGRAPGCPIGNQGLTKIAAWNTRAPITPAEAARALLPFLDAGEWQKTVGPYSWKNNQCRHQKYGYEGCEDCLVSALRALAGDQP